MEHVNFSDINTDDGKVKVLNRIIDEVNRLATVNDEYNESIDKYNKSVDRFNKKGVK